ncbi:MAG: hypothetical protein ACTSUE_00135 [Promethearchaeota archaeon]
MKGRPTLADPERLNPLLQLNHILSARDTRFFIFNLNRVEGGRERKIP